jgi:signal transduction histidine kinase
VRTLVQKVRDNFLELLSVGLVVGSVVEVWVVHPLHHRGLMTVMALGWSAPIVVRRRYPFWAPLTVVGFVTGASLIDSTKDFNRLSTPFFMALVVAVSFGLLDSRRRVAGILALLSAATIINTWTGSKPSNYLWTTVIFVLVWGVGVMLGSRTEQTRQAQARAEAAERERVLAVERAAADERARIARELHDIVAHSLSVMVVQAGGVRRLLGAGMSREHDALLAVEETGRQALTEMRRLLGVLRETDGAAAELAPQPGLSSLEALAQQVRDAGLPVTVRVEGKRAELPPGIELSAYRIVQEGLTNAIKHANCAHAEVLVRFGKRDLELEVSDDGASAVEVETNGFGLAGMRERVTLYGGTFEAGPRDGGGFRVRATLPVEARA